MKYSRFLFVTLIASGATACSPIDPVVTLIGPQGHGTPTARPGFHIEATTGVLTGGGLVMKARVSSLSGAMLSGGGMTLTQGVVK